MSYNSRSASNSPFIPSCPSPVFSPCWSRSPSPRRGWGYDSSYWSRSSSYCSSTSSSYMSPYSENEEEPYDEQEPNFEGLDELFDNGQFTEDSPIVNRTRGRSRSLSSKSTRSRFSGSRSSSCSPKLYYTDSHHFNYDIDFPPL